MTLSVANEKSERRVLMRNASDFSEIFRDTVEGDDTVTVFEVFHYLQSVHRSAKAAARTRNAKGMLGIRGCRASQATAVALPRPGSPGRQIQMYETPQRTVTEIDTEKLCPCTLRQNDFA
jgi:hypothetical protein